MTIKNSNILDIKVDNYGECGYCKNALNKVELYIPWKIWSQWIYLTMKNHDREWSAVFWVKKNKVVRFEIPEQEVSSASVEFLEDLGGDGIVHSHHSMGAFHSSQDDKHERNLYDYSIVLDSKYKYVACQRIKLPCGGWGYVDCDLLITKMPNVSEDNIMSKSKYITTPNQYHYLNDKKEEKNIIVPKTEENEELELIRTGGLPYGDYDLPCYNCVERDCQNCDMGNYV